MIPLHLEKRNDFGEHCANPTQINKMHKITLDF